MAVIERPRCEDCGFLNGEGAEVCAECGAALGLSLPTIPVASVPCPRPSAAEAQVDSRAQEPPTVPEFGPIAQPQPREPRAPIRQQATQAPNWGLFPCQVRGEVIDVEAPMQVAPDFNWPSFLTRGLWLIVLVGAPVVLVREAVTRLDVGSIVLCLFGLFVLLRFFSPLNLLAVLHLFREVTGSRQRETSQVPMFFFHVRDGARREYVVRVKGLLTRGNIRPGDLVNVWGRWRDGVLMFSRAYNERTRSWTLLKPNHSWLSLALSIAVVIYLLAAFHEPVLRFVQTLQDVSHEGRLP